MLGQQIESTVELICHSSDVQLHQLLEQLVMNSTFFHNAIDPFPLIPSEVDSIVNALNVYLCNGIITEMQFVSVRPLVGNRISVTDFLEYFSNDFALEGEHRIEKSEAIHIGVWFIALLLRLKYCSDEGIPENASMIFRFSERLMGLHKPEFVVQILNLTSKIVEAF